MCLLLTTELSASPQVLAFSGSTREESFNNRLVLEATSIAEEEGAQVEVINLKSLDIPLYDGDLEKEEGLPEGARKLRTWMKKSDIIIIASPEYNGSVSGVLKNAIDWASRNESQQFSREAFLGKKFLIMSTSPGKGGGKRGLVHLKAIIENVGGTVLPSQIVVPQAYTAFDPEGHLKDETKRSELVNAVEHALSH